MNYSRVIARKLLEIGAVGFTTSTPIRFKSGILAPVYVDNRIFPAHVKAWRTVIRGFKNFVDTEKIKFDVIAGIESAGIPHSATLGYVLNKPSVFIRKKTKDHGTKKSIEGGEVTGKRVLLVEDHVTMGTSSLHGVEVLREVGATVTDCLAITHYAFPSSRQAFAEARVKLHVLTSFEDIFAAAMERKMINKQMVGIVKTWMGEPWAWTKKHEADLK
ncbi:MAG TPA: orotate phosphoribosyltransferase [Patescibacteria group bacterium]|jgi:orotate phosphoribosyltransferase